MSQTVHLYLHMPEYKNEPIYQEVAITEYKHKALSRQDLFLLLSLSGWCLNAFISETIMTTSRMCTQSAHKFYFYMPAKPHAPAHSKTNCVYSPLQEGSLPKWTDRGNLLLTPCTISYFYLLLLSFTSKNKKCTGCFVKRLAKNSVYLWHPIKAK